MAENLALEKCTYHPDVVAAIFSPDFGQTSRPFTRNDIPGVIAAVDYDLGTNGIAYSDNDYKRERWDVWEPWNTGGAYRSDGVDIEESQNNPGQKYNIGWIEAGEWISYTVNITPGGVYALDLLMASPESSGRLSIFLNDHALARNLAVKSSGGWQNWITIRLEEVNLPAGTHRLKLVFDSGGYNFSQMKFTLTSTLNLEPLNQEIYYGQNYPNPFNDGTRIPFILTRPLSGEVSIYDMTGQLIRTLAAGQFEQNRYDLEWDGRDNQGRKVASGMYCYYLSIDGFTAVKKMTYLR
jgi:hypothetical protein